MKRMNKKAFTIVELVIVIAVIAVLAAVLIPTFSGIVNKAKESAALQEVKQAYTEALADDLSNGDGEDLVYGKDEIIVKHENGTYIKITANGEASVIEDAGEKYTYDLVDGKFVPNGSGNDDTHTHVFCTICGKCTETDCDGEKCLGHTDPDDPENNEPTLDLSTLQQYHCFVCERKVVFYKDQIEHLMENHGSVYNGDTVLRCPYCENASNRLVADSEVTVTINTTPVEYICYRNLTEECTYQTSLTDLELYYKLQTGELEGTSIGAVMCPAKRGTCGSMLYSEEEYNKLPKPDLTTPKHYYCGNDRCGFTVDLTQTQYQNLKNKNGAVGICPLCISGTLGSDQSAATTDCCQAVKNATVTITCPQRGCTYKKEMSLAEYINDFLYVTKYSFKTISNIRKIACGVESRHQGACEIEVTYLDE